MSFKKNLIQICEERWALRKSGGDPREIKIFENLNKYSPKPKNRKSPKKTREQKKVDEEFWRIMDREIDGK